MYTYFMSVVILTQAFWNSLIMSDELFLEHAGPAADAGKVMRTASSTKGGWNTKQPLCGASMLKYPVKQRRTARAAAEASRATAEASRARALAKKGTAESQEAKAEALEAEAAAVAAEERFDLLLRTRFGWEHNLSSPDVDYWCLWQKSKSAKRKLDARRAEKMEILNNKKKINR